MNSNRLIHKLIVLIGIDKEACNLENRDFQDYLDFTFRIFRLIQIGY